MSIKISSKWKEISFEQMNKLYKNFPFYVKTTVGKNYKVTEAIEFDCLEPISTHWCKNIGREKYELWGKL